MASIQAPQHNFKSSSPQDEFFEAICRSPAAPAGKLSIVADGKVHRYLVAGDKGTSERSGSGYYKFYSDGIPAGFFGSWKGGGFHCNWHASGTFSAEQWAEYKLRCEAAEAEREVAAQKQRAVAAATAATMGRSLDPADDKHPYLVAKKIKAHGVYQTVEDFPKLAVPISVNGQHTSWEFIDSAGRKQFLSGGNVKGGYFQFGDLSKNKRVYLCEGYATGATIFETTDVATVISFSANNLTDVAVWLRKNLGDDKDIVIVADNDDSGTGEREANKAAKASKSRVVLIPIFGMDANDYRNAGNDLQGLLERRKWLTILEDFVAKKEGTKWLVENWLPAESLSMIFSDPGAGKTFFILDWALSIATGVSEWCGKKVTQGNVIYLAGEGHSGLKKRLAGWLQEHGILPAGIQFYIAEYAVDLNTPEGTAQAIADIRSLGVENIVLIVVDTLNRFLLGDENSAQDARTMIRACGDLQGAFNCAVSLIHHTGVALENKNRARGSSAWLGALDTQIQIKTDSNYNMTIIQTKQKDIEKEKPLYMHLDKIYVNGFVTQDGTSLETTLIPKQRDTPPPPGDTPVEQKEPRNLVQAKHVYTRASLAKDIYGYVCTEFAEDGSFRALDTAKWLDWYSQSDEMADSRKDSVKRSFDRIKKLLVNNGWITEEDGKCIATEKWKCSGQSLQFPHRDE